jgi:integrase/recombinase XerD
VLAIPFNRIGSRSIHYFEYDEIQAVLASVDRTTADGRRDYALLAIMFNTGARVQEIVTLCVHDLPLEALPQVRLCGEGRKELTQWDRTRWRLRSYTAACA